MKTIYEYIENRDVKSINNKYEGTTSSAERREELKQWLKGKDYENYVDILNKMLDDPKAAALLVDGFGGELGDTKLKFTTPNLVVSGLVPTQSEIDVSKSIDWELKNPEYLETILKNKPIVFSTPLITFRHNYVIDGHHRWSQVYAFNPDAKMTCFNYEGDISPIQMLKATQGAIAAKKAESENDEKIPSEVVEGQNLFDKAWNREKIVEYIKSKEKDNKYDIAGCVNVMKSYKKEIDTLDKFAEYVADNLMQLKSSNPPIESAPNRGDMPQTDKAGNDPDDPSTSSPKTPGSALNKLKDGEFVQAAVK